MSDLDPASLAALHALRAPTLSPPASVDDQTWSDLDLDRLQATFPVASSLGQLVLHGWLRSPALDPAGLEAVARRRPAAAAAAAPAVRRELGGLPFLPPFLLEVLYRGRPLPSLGRWPWALTAVALLAPWLFLVSTKVGVVVTTVVFTANALFHFWADKQVFAAVGSLAFLAAAIAAGRRLADAPGLPEDARAQLARLGRSLRRLQRACGELWLPPPADDLALYPRIFLLSGERRLGTAARLVEAARPEVVELLELLGALDAAQAVEAVEASYPHCRPEPENGDQLVIEGLRHPLLGERAVPSELRLEGVLAVTGSNMSGKSTFLRAVGVNALLAQALGFGCATRYRGPLLRLATSLRVADDLGKGQSTYLAEARRLKAMLEGAATGRTLFLVDEPFRGTNSPERIAAGVALLRHLRREGHLAIAATHDLEVASTAASDGMASAHFADGVTAEGLSFDHQLRPGVSREHNALKLLEVLGLPAAMVAEARAYAKERG